MNQLAKTIRILKKENNHQNPLPLPPRCSQLKKTYCLLIKRDGERAWYEK